MFEIQLNRIKEKLEYIQTNGWVERERDFMTPVHGFQLAPTISEAELTDFEKEFKIQLPNDYKEFLMTIGNGGAGPYYGLLPLEYWYEHEAMWEEQPLEELEEDGFFNPREHFSQPCQAHPDPILGYGIDNNREIPQKWTTGTIALSNQGCKHYALLVVKEGENYGKVCYSEIGSPYFMPDRNFISWYERWLDEVLSGKEIHWFGGYGYMEQE